MSSFNGLILSMNAALQYYLTNNINIYPNQRGKSCIKIDFTLYKDIFILSILSLLIFIVAY